MPGFEFGAAGLSPGGVVPAVAAGVGGEPVEGGAGAGVDAAAAADIDGFAENVLWAVDGTRIVGFTDEDRGSGTANLSVEGDLAVRGLNGMILRVNYIVFSV